MDSFCFICRDDSFDYITECGHKFHSECFKPWFKKTKTCPYCRIALNFLGNRLIFSKPCAVCGDLLATMLRGVVISCTNAAQVQEFMVKEDVPYIISR